MNNKQAMDEIKQFLKKQVVIEGSMLEFIILCVILGISACITGVALALYLPINN